MAKEEVKELTPEELEQRENEKKSSAISGFVFAMLSVATAFTIQGLIFAILGLSYSNNSSKVQSPNLKGLSTVGKVVSIIYVILHCLVILALIASFVLSVIALFAYLGILAFYSLVIAATTANSYIALI